LQNSEALRELYEREPDCGYWPAITDRESELWGPLLLHSRLAGPEAEARLLTVVETFNKLKGEIQASDWRIAQTIELLDAITRHPEQTFAPSDLVATLSECETWIRTFAEAKGRDDSSIQTAKAAKVGYALRKFRLHGRKNSSGRMTYDRQEAIDCLSLHVPENPPYSPEPPLANAPYSEVAENTCIPEGTEATEALPYGHTDASGEPPITSVLFPEATRDGEMGESEIEGEL
jgi:hypothetical protein